MTRWPSLSIVRAYVSVMRGLKHERTVKLTALCHKRKARTYEAPYHNCNAQHHTIDAALGSSAHQRSHAITLRAGALGRWVVRAQKGMTYHLLHIFFNFECLAVPRLFEIGAEVLRVANNAPRLASMHTKTFVSAFMPLMH